MITIELNRLVENNILWDFPLDFYTDDKEIIKTFQKKFENHYYFNEIGQETIGRFKHRLMTRLNEDMPYYKQLYETEMKSKNIEFLLNKDYRETFNKINRGESISDKIEDLKSNQSTNATSNNSSNLETQENGNSNNINKHKGSHIENGNASLELSNGSLTDVTEDTGNNTVSNTSSSNSSNNSRDTATGNVSQDNKINVVDTHDNIEEYELVGKGNIGTTSSAELLQKWRDVLINIDKIIILSCADLFIGVYDFDWRNI